MKPFFRKLFAPLLNYFEAGEEPFEYRPSHRKILFIVGGLFLCMCTAISAAGFHFGMGGAAIPGVVFFALGGTSIVVAALGTDRGVAKIWNNRAGR